MPNFYDDDYELLELDDDASYEDLMNNYTSIIANQNNNKQSSATELDKITQAKNRLEKLLLPIAKDKLVYAIDFDLTITKKHTANNNEYVNCDDQKILNNFRNPNELKQFILLAINNGHRIAIITFNEKRVAYEEKKEIYLVRHFLLTLLNKDIVAQILIIAKNTYDKIKRHHINMIRKTWGADTHQIAMIDDDEQVLKNTAKSYKNRLTTLLMPIYQSGIDIDHLNILSLLSQTVTNISILNEIPSILELTEQYLKICALNGKDPKKVFELFKQYIAKDFDKIPNCSKLVGLAALLQNAIPYTILFDELLAYKSVQQALCDHPLTIYVFNTITESRLLPHISDNPWNQSALILSLLKARQDFYSQHHSTTLIIIPEQILKMPYHNVVKYFEILLFEKNWHVVTLLFKTYRDILQQSIELHQCPKNIENCYTLFPRFFKQRPTEQIAIGTELLELFRNAFHKSHANHITNEVLFHYLALEISYGTIDSCKHILYRYFNTADKNVLKQKIFQDVLTLQIVPVSCDNDFSSLASWLDLLLQYNAYNDRTAFNEKEFLYQAFLTDDSAIFNSIYSYLKSPPIPIEWLMQTLTRQAFSLFNHLIPLVDAKSLTDLIFAKLFNTPNISLKTLTEARSLFLSRDIAVPELNLEHLLLMDIQHRNLLRIVEILSSHKVNIDLKMIYQAIQTQNADILSLFILSASPTIISNQLLHYIAQTEFITHPVGSIITCKSTRRDLLRTVILTGNVIDIDSVDSRSGMPLIHQLILKCDLQSVQLLLSYGVNTQNKNGHGRSALQFAKDLYETIETATEEDSFELDYETILETPFNSEKQITHSEPFIQKEMHDSDAIILLLDQADKKTRQLVSCETNIIYLYHLIKTNQLSPCQTLLIKCPSVTTQLTDKNHPLGFDLLDIILFNTQNPLMLQLICDNGFIQQLYEPAMFRILEKLTHRIIEQHPDDKTGFLDLFKTLCHNLFRSQQIKSLLKDLALFRQILYVASLDTYPLTSGYHLLDKLVAIIGPDLFHHPLLTENSNDQLNTFIKTVRMAYNKSNLITPAIEVKLPICSTVRITQSLIAPTVLPLTSTITIETTATTSSSQADRFTLEIKDNERLLLFGGNYKLNNQGGIKRTREEDADVINPELPQITKHTTI